MGTGSAFLTVKNEVPVSDGDERELLTIRLITFGGSLYERSKSGNIYFSWFSL